MPEALDARCQRKAWAFTEIPWRRP